MLPAGSTSRLMVLACAAPHVSWNFQQPADGASTMLGPPFTVITACVLPGGIPSTTKFGAMPLATQSTLLFVPSMRGLLPATNSFANRKATDWPPVPSAQVTLHGVTPG